MCSYPLPRTSHTQYRTCIAHSIGLRLEKNTIGINCMASIVRNRFRASAKHMAKQIEKRTYTHTHTVRWTHAKYSVSNETSATNSISQGCVMPPSRDMDNKCVFVTRMPGASCRMCVCARPLPMLLYVESHKFARSSIFLGVRPFDRSMRYSFGHCRALLLLFEHKYFILTDKLIKVDEHPSAPLS